MKIRQNAISHAKRKSRGEFPSRRRNINKRKKILDLIICNSDDLQNIEDTLKEYDALKSKIQSFYVQKGKAAMFRSKCRWLEDGEQPTSFFLI